MFHHKSQKKYKKKEKQLIKYCIFDLDGTLLNTIHTIRYYVNSTLSLIGLGEISVEECKRFVGDGARMLIKRTLNKFGITDESAVDSALEKYTALYDSAPLYLTEVYEGVREALLTLKQKGVKLAVLSNKPDFATKSVVRYFFGEDIFFSVRGAMPCVQLKPNPESVNTLLCEVGATSRETAFVGDTSVDILTGKNAELALTVGVLWGFRDREELCTAGADRIVSSAKELVCEVIDYE